MFFLQMQLRSKQIAVLPLLSGVRIVFSWFIEEVRIVFRGTGFEL
jgi:hypothetical protein